MSLEQLTAPWMPSNSFSTTGRGLQCVADKRECYRWMQRTLVKHRYFHWQNVTRYLMKVTGYSYVPFQSTRPVRGAT